MKQENNHSGNLKTADLMFFTSDNLAFFDEQKAVNHAKKLADKAIITRTKKQVEADSDYLVNECWEEDVEEDICIY